MTWILLGLLLVLLGGIAYVLYKQHQIGKSLAASKPEETTYQMLQQQIETIREQMRLGQEGHSNLLQKQLESLNNQLNARLKDSHELVSSSQKNVGDRLDNASKVVAELQGKLGKLEESHARLLEVGQDIRSLQEILKSPKLRGNLGEFLLGDLLAQILPKENYQLQYGFKNNEKVDAVIRLGGKLVSVDAKFPLENFQRFLGTQDESEKRNYKKQFVSDVRKHIDAIASKYIRPDEGTYDFALMFVPAENVYYEVIVKDEAAEGEHVLANRAMNKRVIPVSPNTLYVYLNTIVLGLKGMQIEKVAQEIMGGLARLGNDLNRIQEAFRKVGVHLHNANSAYENTQGRLSKFGDRMERLHGQPAVDGNLPAEDDKISVLPSGK